MLMVDKLARDGELDSDGLSVDDAVKMIVQKLIPWWTIHLPQKGPVNIVPYRA